jgi:hypothetical protein
MTTTTTTTVAEQIGALTDTCTGVFTPLHDSLDQDKVAELAADMAEHGWRGAPLVTEGGANGKAYTGSHRIAAVVHLWNDHGVEVPIPYINITELCSTYGVDWAALLDEWVGDTYQAAAALRFDLPREVVEYLGFDVDGDL